MRNGHIEVAIKELIALSPTITKETPKVTPIKEEIVSIKIHLF